MKIGNLNFDKLKLRRLENCNLKVDIVRIENLEIANLETEDLKLEHLKLSAFQTLVQAQVKTQTIQMGTTRISKFSNVA